MMTQIWIKMKMTQIWIKKNKGAVAVTSAWIALVCLGAISCNKVAKMDYVQFLTIMATLIAGFGFMYKEFKGFEKDIREDIKTQSGRSDQLYTMFIDLLKVRKDP